VADDLSPSERWQRWRLARADKKAAKAAGAVRA
jgi:hypothetical protein